MNQFEVYSGYTTSPLSYKNCYLLLTEKFIYVLTLNLLEFHEIKKPLITMIYYPTFKSPFLHILYFILLFPAFTSVFSQTQPAVKATIIKEQVTIDGVLDEELWAQAEPVTGFIQYEPVEGAIPSQKTEVKMLFGEAALYIGAVMYDNPSEIERAMGKRDEYNRADWFMVSLDSYFNRRMGYTFAVSAAGVQMDGQRSIGGGPGGPGGGGGPRGLDNSWDAIWFSEVSITDEGWIVEIRIPYSQLRFSADNETWGVHFTRRIARSGEILEWPMVGRTERNNLVANYGLITEIRDIEPRRNIQIRPYTLSRLNTRESHVNPGNRIDTYGYDIGGDIKVGLGPNIMLDATINPDFGQVESDPAVLNLTAFETLYPEKRPFFIEGVDIFEFQIGPGSMFYSRRIGARDPIIGAAKLSGRTAGGLSLGLLAATTGNDFDPSAGYGITRMSQQIGEYSSIGGIFTGTSRPLPQTDGRLQSLAGGVDWDLRNRENSYGITGNAVFTQRKFKIIDDYSEEGFAGRLEFTKREGAITGDLAFLVMSDGFNPNDLGQMRQRNFYEGMTRIEYDINGGRPFWNFQRASAGVFMLQRFSYDESLDLGDRINFDTRWNTNNFQQIEFEVSMDNIFNGYDLYETRGLGPWATPHSVGLAFEYTTDERRNWILSPEFEYEFFEGGGRGYEMSVRGESNIGNRLSISGSINGSIENGVTAWVSNESFIFEGGQWMTGIRSVHPDLLNSEDLIVFEDNGELEALVANLIPVRTNAYFIPAFGERDTRAFDLTLRGTYTLSPDLSFQLYSQMFVAKGKYDEFSLLVNPDEQRPFRSYPKKSDFSYKSLLSNMVLRWEYRPGSTLYFVWSHGRSEEDIINPLYPWGDSPYDRRTGTHMGEIFDIFPENAFIIKLNYTFL
jgi:hypothetical protein